MHTTLKISLQRLRQVAAINLNRFTLGALMTLAIYAVTSWINPRRIFDFDVAALANILTPIYIGLIFLTPVLILATSFISEKIRGMTEVRIDPAAAKHSVFILAGCLWPSLGILIVLSVAGYTSLSLTTIAAGIIAVASWYYLCRIAITYVKG